MPTNPEKIHTIVQAALAAFKRGDKLTARRLAKLAASLGPDSEGPWLVLAALAEPQESLAYVQNALRINPDNPQAQKALAWAQERLAAQPPAAQPAAPPEPTQPPAEQPAILTEEAPPASGEADIPTSPVKTVRAARPAGPSLRLPWKLPRLAFSPVAVRWMAVGITVIALIVVVVFLRPLVVNLYQQVFNAPPCGAPQLVLGEAKFRIQSKSVKAGDAIPVPAVNAGTTAFWMEGTTINYDFTLNSAAIPAPAAEELKPGLAMAIHWGDCTQENYVVSAVDPGVLDPAVLLDQTSGGARVFVQSGASGDGLLVRGVRPEALVTASPEPTEPGAVQAEVNFLDNAVSADGKTVSIRVSIKNTGSQPISLTAGEISLGPEEGAAQPPSSSNPALPLQVTPGETKEIALTFPYNGEKALVFKLLDFSVELYY